jgi:hypothetical protein
MNILTLRERELTESKGESAISSLAREVGSVLGIVAAFLTNGKPHEHSANR